MRPDVDDVAGRTRDPAHHSGTDAKRVVGSMVTLPSKWHCHGDPGLAGFSVAG